jgi:hypothetical protein
VRPLQQLATASVLAGAVYTLFAVQELKSLTSFPCTLISVLIAFVFRVVAVGDHWRSIVPVEAPAEGRS